MTIVHLVPHVRNAGNGLVNVAVDLACWQAKNGHRVFVVGEGGDFEPLLAEYGVDFSALVPRRGIISFFQNARAIYRTLRARKPNIVHAHTMSGAVYGFVLRFSGNYGLISTVHTAFRRSSILMALADRIIAVSDANKRDLMRRGVPGSRIAVIHNAPLESPRRSVRAHDVSLGRPSITTVAGLYRRKGIDVLIEAFDRVSGRFPEAHLYLIGAGPDEAEFRAQATAVTSATRIHFLGFKANPQPYLESTDIFVLASREDPFPLVIAEARYAGCAIVGSDVDGIPETLDGGRAGMLVPAGDAGPLAAALSTLLESDEVRSHWREEAKRGVERFMVGRVVRETQHVYDTVASAKYAT